MLKNPLKIEKQRSMQNKSFILKVSLHESNGILGKHYLRSNEKKCTLHRYPSPTYKIINSY